MPSLPVDSATSCSTHSPKLEIGSETTNVKLPRTDAVAASCAMSRYHVDERIAAEIVDVANGAVLPAGRDGMVALTLLDGDTALLRYSSGLTGRMLPSPCTCGAAGTVLEIA